MTVFTSPTVIGRRKYKSTSKVVKNIIVKLATVSTDETVTFSEVAALGSAHVCLVASPGTELTCTVATNVVTITEGAQTDVDVLVIGVET